MEKYAVVQTEAEKKAQQGQEKLAAEQVREEILRKMQEALQTHFSTGKQPEGEK